MLIDRKIERAADQAAGNRRGPLACIALLNNAEMGSFYVDLARTLKDRFNSTIHLYCYNEQELAFYRKHPAADIFESISIVVDPLRTAREPVRNVAEELAAARDYESRIGCTYNTLASYNRHFGRGYLLGAPGYPRSHYTNKISYEQMVAAFNRGFAYWEQEVAAKRITLFLSGDKLIARAAVLTGRPFRRLANSRFKNFYHWAENEFFEVPGLQERFENIKTVESAELLEPYYSHRVFSSHVARRSNFIWLLIKLATLVTRRVYWYLRGYEKARSLFLRDEIALQIRRWRDHRLMTGATTVKLSEIPEDQPFVFFPMHTEPEASVHQLSPEYFYQHGAIAALSRDLPAGVKLCVKETIYGTGRRPREFYRQVADLKNVVWLNMLEPGLEVVKRAAAVATITGTAGFEAAVTGKPVISFGRHNIYAFLPHVFVVSDEAKLKDQLATIFSGSLDKERARADGARFLETVASISFDLDSHSTVNRGGYDKDSVAAAADMLVTSLDVFGGGELPVSPVAAGRELV